MSLRAALAAACLCALALAATGASGGYVTGSGAARTAHLSDGGNGVEASVQVPETFSGFAGHTYAFVLVGSNATATRTYFVEVVVSPGSDNEARWNASGQGPSGPSNTTIAVTIPPDDLPFTFANTPFQVELRASDGSLLDAAQFAVDLHYREPPPDGGMLHLAIATGFFWGLVFLYAFYLHLAQRKLRARADALDRPLGRAPEAQGDGKNR